MKKINSKNIFVHLLFVISLLSFCKNIALGQEEELKAETGISSPLEKALKEAESYFALREEKAMVEKAIEAYKKVLEMDAENLDAYVRLSRSYYWLGDAFCEDKETKMKMHEEGYNWALKGCQLNPGFKKEFEKGKKIKKAMDALNEKFAGALYWAAANLGRWAKAKGVMSSLSRLSELKAINQKLLEIDPGYYNGGPDRFFAVIYAELPGIFGGDLAKSKEHFEKSIQWAPNYFVTRVLYAELYATKIKDRQLFKEQLEFVINTPPEIMPEFIPEQKLEQKKARKLLSQIDELFKK